MSQSKRNNRLDRPVDENVDHILGPAKAEITLVEYGSYDCPSCRAANEAISLVRDQFGDRMRYVFRHRPIHGSEIALRAAELVEHATDQECFWDAHVKLMTRSDRLSEDDLNAVADYLNVDMDKLGSNEATAVFARARVEADMASASASSVEITPTFFINGRRYLGPWDQHSLSDAMIGTLGHRMQTAVVEFVSWGPSAGLLLLLATLMAVALTNTMFGSEYHSFWGQEFGFTFDGNDFRMPLLNWINDGLLTVFFLVVGLEIKREFLVGHLANRRSAALPVAASLGGMVVPALLYLWIIPAGELSNGWGIPMATDTAFAVALIALLGKRAPVELRVFLTAAAVVDDIAAIFVIAVFYSSELHLGYLALAGFMVACLALLNRAHVYLLSPYMLVGIVLWASIHAGGVHATLAGVILAMFIPTRPPPNLKALIGQANTIIMTEAEHGGEVLRNGPSLTAMHALDGIHDRLESPAARLLRHAGARSSYLVLPLFALANAGVVISMDVVGGNQQLMLAIIAGLAIGKPLGMLSASLLAVWTGVAVKPSAYSWGQLCGAGALAGIGFTMSLFVAGQALPMDEDFSVAKIAVFTASIISAALGVLLLWHAGHDTVVQRNKSLSE